MEQRIDMLEREVSAIKADIAVIKSAYWTREEMRPFDARLARMEADIAVLQADVAQLKSEVIAIKKDISEIRDELAEIRLELVQLKTAMQHCVTKADFHELEARLKTWMIASIFAAISVMSGIQFGLYTAFSP